MADYGNVIGIAQKRLPGVKPSVYTNSQDTVCLRLSDPEGKSKTQVADIKDELGVKDGVIRNSGNTPEVATNRRRWADNATLEGSMSIPVKDLGQKFSIFNRAKNNEIKNAAQESLKNDNRTK